MKNDDDGNGSGDGRTAMVTFTNTAQTGPAKYQGTFTIDTKADNTNDEAHGAIEVKLETHTEGNYTVSATTDEDHVDITIVDATKPLIKISDSPAEDLSFSTFTNNLVEFQHRITFVSDIEPYAALTIKYDLTEPNSNFLKVSGPAEPSLTFTAASPATNPQTYTSTVTFTFVDRFGQDTGEYTLTLLEDSDNYTLGTGTEKARAFPVKDPSYIQVNTYGYAGSAATMILRSRRAI